MRHEIPDEQVRRDSTLVPPSASKGPLKNMDASYPARKAHAHEIHEKAVDLQNFENDMLFWSGLMLVDQISNARVNQA